MGVPDVPAAEPTYFDSCFNAKTYSRSGSRSPSFASSIIIFATAFVDPRIPGGDDFAVNGNLPQAAERAVLDCQIEENALYITAVASSAPGHGQAIALIRAAVEQLKANLKAAMLASPPTMPP